ncbi:MAG: DUF262 domain-containing protein [Patulibacter sp.]|nr:DUF262 domain-containing protein [Patulibacter sp.]
MTSGPNEHDPIDIAVELDDAGRSSGVEAETIESDVITEPFDPRLIDVTTETRTLDSVIKRLALKQIDLDPDFQRSRGIWTAAKKSLLIESLLLRIPLPTFYVAEVDAPDAELASDPWAVVDGIQRLSTISEFVGTDQEPGTLRLAKVEYLKSEEGKTFGELPQALQLRVLESQFTFQVIRRSTPEPVQLNIFARINTGGVPLSPQELRHALTPGPARAFLRELAESTAFERAVASSVSPTRMADREMVLRFLAFRKQDFDSYTHQDFNGFLRTAMQKVNDWSESQRRAAKKDLEKTLGICVKIFENDAFRKRYSVDQPRRPVSKALFECVSVAVSTTIREFGPGAAKRLEENGPSIRAAFVELMGDPDFDRAVSQGTGDPLRVRQRFESMIQLMRTYAQ